VFGVLHPWLFGSVYVRLTRDLTVERTAFAIRLGLYAVFGAALAVCGIVFDYAKVRAVVGRFHSVLSNPITITP
jgi:hypothetical protein